MLIKWQSVWWRHLNDPISVFPNFPSSRSSKEIPMSYSGSSSYTEAIRHKKFRRRQSFVTVHVTFTPYSQHIHVTLPYHSCHILSYHILVTFPTHSRHIPNTFTSHCRVIHVTFLSQSRQIHITFTSHSYYIHVTLPSYSRHTPIDIHATLPSPSRHIFPWHSRHILIKLLSH